MRPVTTLDNQTAPVWEVAKVRLLGLQDGDTLSFGVDDDTWLIVLHITAFGYLGSPQ